jgi:hypothetical protein
MVRETLIPWQDGDTADANVIVEVRNTSSSAIDLESDFQDFSVLDGSGDVVAVGELTGPFPWQVAPGALGYLTAEVNAGGGVDATTMVKLKLTLTFAKAKSKDIVLTVSGTANKPGADGRTGASTSGMVTNTSRIGVEEVAVGAFYYGSAGSLLGYSYGGPSNLGPGKTKAFVTDVGAPPLDFSQIDHTVVIADSFCRSGPCLP